MNVAFVFNKIEPTGGDRICRHHIDGLRSLGHTVDVYATGWLDLFDSREWSKNIIEYEFGKLCEFDLSRKKYDIVVANGMNGFRSAKHADAENLVWFCQNYDPYIFGKTPDVTGLYDECDRFLLYSSDLRKIIRYYHGDKHFVMCTNGVEYSQFEPYQKTKMQSVDRVGFMVAYYRPYKGMKLAEQIFSRLKAKGYTTVEVNVVGGPLPSTMEYYRDPVFQKKAQIIAGCAVTIHPSVFETWNLTSMESMALGTPVVGVNSKGIMEYATSKNSVIIEGRNPDELCREIISLLSDEARYLDKQREGIKTAKAADWNTIMLKIEQSYKELL